MATEVIMPKVDMDQSTGTVLEWLFNEGDTVKKGEPLLVIETDKVSIEVEAPASGILQGISAPVGTTVPIATQIATILAPGESLPTSQAAPAAAAAAPAAMAQAAPAQAAPAPPVPATPVARNVAAAAGVDLATVAGSGPRGKVTRNDVEAALVAAPPGGNGHPAAGGPVNATPAARQLAREQGVDLKAVRGSGPGQRVQAADVIDAAAQPQAAPAPVGAALEDEIVPLIGMRRTIADRMQASYQQAPHITFVARVDMTRLNEARTELNAHAEQVGAGRISATAMLVKAVAVTLTRHPYLNSALKGDEIHLRRDINVGVAVALDEGLIVPVVRNADRKGIAQIAAEVDDVAARARSNQLVPSDVTDGTFTLSNLGPFGVEQFTAIINPPQAAILAVGATQPEAVPQPDGQIVARPIMRMTLSADHRIIDGAVAARFIADLKATLEQPMLLLW